MNIIFNGYGISSLFFILIASILGYFVYGSVNGALGMVLLTFFFTLSLFIALIRFCGVAIQAMVMHFLVVPFVLNLTALEQTGLVTGFFWIYLVMGLFLTLLTSVSVVVGGLNEKHKIN